LEINNDHIITIYFVGMEEQEGQSDCSWETLIVDGKQHIKLFHISKEIAVYTPHDINSDIFNEKKEDSFILTFDKDMYYNVSKKRIAKQVEISSALKDLDTPWILKPDVRSELCKMLCGGIKKQKLKSVKGNSNTKNDKKNNFVQKINNKKKKNEESEEEDEEEQEDLGEEDDLEEDENEEEIEEDADEELREEEEEEDDQEGVVLELEQDEEDDEGEEDDEEFVNE
jgi:hypothetical protein